MPWGVRLVQRSCKQFLGPSCGSLRSCASREQSRVTRARVCPLLSSELRPVCGLLQTQWHVAVGLSELEAWTRPDSSVGQEQAWSSLEWDAWIWGLQDTQGCSSCLSCSWLIQPLLSSLKEDLLVFVNLSHFGVLSSLSTCFRGAKINTAEDPNAWWLWYSFVCFLDLTSVECNCVHADLHGLCLGSTVIMLLCLMGPIIGAFPDAQPLHKSEPKSAYTYSKQLSRKQHKPITGL